MNRFRYARADDVGGAIATALSDPGATFIAGGTEQLNLIKDRIQSPSLLVDLNQIPLATIVARDDAVQIGALARLNDIAAEPTIRDGYPVLSEAIRSAASAQVRNMAAIGGNLMQRTRCPYYRDVAFACNRRTPGAGCAAIGGENRWHAIFGGSDRCIAVHPSDPAVALVALDAVVLIEGPNGARSIPLEEFHLLPGETPERETVLEHGELIVGVEPPTSPFARRSRYLKVRDRASFEFALVSVAAALHVESRIVRDARIVLGGVAPKPWRARAAEDALRDRPLAEAAIARAAEAAVEGAQPLPGNAFKVELAKRAIVRTLTQIGGLS